MCSTRSVSRKPFGTSRVTAVSNDVMRIASPSGAALGREEADGAAGSGVASVERPLHAASIKHRGSARRIGRA